MLRFRAGRLSPEARESGKAEERATVETAPAALAHGIAEQQGKLSQDPLQVKLFARANDRDSNGTPRREASSGSGFGKTGRGEMLGR